MPDELVPAGDMLSRQIMPLKLSAFRGRKEIHRPGQSNFYPGILPNGTNTVLLAVVQGSRNWSEPLTVQISVR